MNNRLRTPRSSPWVALAALGVLLNLALESRGQAEITEAGREFFEAKVRPLLLARCVECHGPDKQKGGLRLDTRASVLEQGGASGPSIEPGKPEESLLIEAIGYDDPALQMPPRGKLPQSDIDVLTEWVRLGAPWPEAKTPAPGEATATEGIDLAARGKHWSFQQVRRTSPPQVRDAAWPRTPIDAFLLARLESEGLKPAPETDRRTLIRRLTFDLTGLPPTPDEVDRFVADDRVDAYERLVDRLLASPAYGERWGRHWLDLVRYAETSGHEFDYDIQTAWRYRDYVVRSWNADLPYDQLVTEHLAGDLLPAPRRDPATGSNESIQGTGFFFLSEGTHSPVDVREDELARLSNQIDVVGKTFLGLTIACARCHDHKFDPITSRDYYALGGYLRSTRHQYAFLDAPETLDQKVAELDSRRAQLAQLLSAPAIEPAPQAVEPSTIPFVDFGAATAATSFPDGWHATGQAWGRRPTQAGEISVRPAGEQGGPPRLVSLKPGVAHSGASALGLQGVLRSPTFAIETPYLLVEAAGRKGRIQVVVDGFEKIRDPIYGALTRAVDHGEELRWVVIDVSMWVGHRAYIELIDGAAMNYTSGTSGFWPGDGYLAVSRIAFAQAPPVASSASVSLAETSVEIPESIRPQVDDYAALVSSLPSPTLAVAAVDGTGEDMPVHVRGSAKSLGAPAPRRFLQVFDGQTWASNEASGSPEPTGSGRLELAQSVVDPANPLTARVIVNRLWHHHFGRGLVPTPDDFGAMGQPPSHPELLDWLASELTRSGWSLKAMTRLMVTSQAYRMSSRPDPASESVDPTNRWIHRANVRRLEAEAIRDTILAVSGRLDQRVGGPSVAPYLTPFMEGRGRPGTSGPLDGDGRRSLYLGVRRNFLTPLFLAFDFPAPASTMGRRTVSNVPAQALTLLNDPFVADEARRWARSVSSTPNLDTEAAIDRLYQAAFSRPPTPQERQRALMFLTGDGTSDPQESWAELTHALINAKEFVFVP